MHDDLMHSETDARMHTCRHAMLIACLDVYDSEIISAH